MEYIRTNFLLQNEIPEKQDIQNYEQIPYQEVFSHNHEISNYFQMFYEYPERSYQGQEVYPEWEWRGEQVLVKEEDLEAGASASFSEEGIAILCT